MKKIFTLAIAAFAALTMNAVNLFDASTTTFESWFGDGGWAPITTSTASWDATTGTISCTLNQAPFGQWHAQLKLQTTGIVLDAAKNYEFKATFTSSVAAGGITAKMFDNAVFSEKSDIAVEANVPFDYTSAAFKGGDTGNGIIAFDLGNCPNGAVVTINNIIIQESTAPVVEDPKPTTAPAAPTADAATVLSVYSNTYPAAAPFGFLEGWGQSTTLEELNLDGNTVLYYKNFNWLGWGCQGTPIDASTCTGLHLDIWAAAAGSIRVVPIYGGAGLTTDDSHGKVVTLVEGWNSVDLNLATDFAGLNFESIFQFKFDQNEGGSIFAFDNVYFTGYTAPLVTYVNLSELANHVGDTIALKDFEVVYAPAADNRYYYIKDKTAASLIYKAGYGLVAGDKVAKGMEAKVENYKGLLELIPVTAKADLTITPGTAPDPVNATAAPTADDQSKYVVYKKVKVVADTAFVSSSKNTVMGIFGKDTIAFYNSFKIAATLEASKEYDIVGVNSVYNTPQVLPVSVTEHQGRVDDCAGEHGLYDPATATINHTYFGPNWNEGAGADYTASIEGADIVMHVGAVGPVDMWNAQIFVDPGFAFTPGKAYRYEFDIVSSGKVCITIKVNDRDDYPFFVKSIYDFNIGGGTYHFSTDSVFANDSLKTTQGPLVFGFGWTDANQDVIIKCIKITEIGDAPQPVEKKMYIKHPWGTGAQADCTWQEMSERTYMNVDAWTYTGAWGGAGFNINTVAEDEAAKWFAADAGIRFLDADGIIVEAPAVGTANCEFIYVPSLDNGGIIPCAYVLLPLAEGFENSFEAVKAVKVIENGKVVIIKNGIRYNALGAQL